MGSLIFSMIIKLLAIMTHVGLAKRKEMPLSILNPGYKNQAIEVYNLFGRETLDMLDDITARLKRLETMNDK